jgi:CCR4-NOT transcription complex subunit 1
LLTEARAHAQVDGRGVPVNRGGPAFQLLLHLALSLSPEGVYALFTAMANQLRYPSSHTNFFATAILALFEECPKDKPAREVATRVLLERVMAMRPYPWGVVVTFNELLRNQKYQLMEQKFVQQDSAIENIFKLFAQRAS